MSRDTHFYYSFLVLPPGKRRALVAVWDFCRAVDDAVDQPPAGGGADAGRVALDGWRGELARCFGDDEPLTAQGRRLKPHVRRFGLPRRPFEDLIDGVGMDLGRRRYATFDELSDYCMRVASSVGLICIEIFGCRHPGARDYAVALGIALQLTNIVRDVPADLAGGRIYLPAEDMRRFGCADDDLRDGRSQRVRALIEFECRRARSFYARAAAALPSTDAGRLIAARIMGAIYFALLERIERRAYDVFSEVVRLPRRRRALIAATLWARVTLRRLAGGA